MSKLKVGTTQAYLDDQPGIYRLERWDGKAWNEIASLSFESKKEADAYGFKHYPNHKK